MGFFNFNNNGSAKPTQAGSQTSSGSSNSAPQSNGSYNGIGAAPGGKESYNGIGNPSNGQAYNGIGKTPSGGDPYNGIGKTPGGAEPYNGIGNAPAQTNGAAQGQPPADAQAQQAAVADPKSPSQQDVKPGAQKAQDANAQQPENAQAGEADQNTDTANAETAEGKEKKDGQQNEGEQKDGADPKSEEKQEGAEGEKKEGEQAADAQKPEDIDINDLMRRMTQRSNKVFMASNKKAKENQTDIASEHLLFGLLSDSEVYRILTDMQVDPKKLDEELKKSFQKGEKKEAPEPTANVKQIIAKAMDVARGVGYQFISPEHMLSAMSQVGTGAGADVLKNAGMKKEELDKKLSAKGATASSKKSEKVEAKSNLEQFTTDLTAKAAAGELNPVIGRHEQIERTIHILSRRSKNNPCMVGEPGTGKTAIVEGLAQRIVKKEVPDMLIGKRILTLEINSIIAGASHRGEFEERLKKLVDELKNAKGEIILFIDEIHTIVGAGGEGASDASNFLKPAMARGEIQLVGATTVSEFRKYIEKDPALERRFQQVHVPEPTEEESIKMLQGARPSFEEFHRVKIPDEAVEDCVRLSKRYIGDRYLPDKAFDLMDEAAAAVKLPLLALPQQIQAKKERIAQLEQDKQEHIKKGENVKAKINSIKQEKLQKELQDMEQEYTRKKSQTTTAVSTETIKDIISQKSGIPVSKLASSESEKLANLEDIMHKRMIGQERAVSAVAQAVRRGRSGLKAPGRPVGGFVFLGPSGTGKTELAKTLAEVMFGQEEAMIRFDMTEYMEKHEVAKLLGPPPGYVGYEEGGKLTNAVRMRPYCVVLFDEVEKAHPDIFNILLQILDDGRLTDNKGHVISFKDAVIICTSNIGSKMIQKELLGTGGSIAEEAAEAPITTYAITADGSEVVSIGSKVYLRDGGITAANEESASSQSEESSDPAEWEEGSLEKYFASQTVSQDSPYKDVTFPVKGYDTHTTAPTGMEMLTKNEYLYTKDAPDKTEWQVQKLEDYFAESNVTNAKEGAKQQQLPTKAVRTHTFSPDGIEYITYGDRMWKRKADTNEWETQSLKDYFTDQKLAEGEFPTSSWDVHLFRPNGEEIIVVKETLWHKDDPSQPDWSQQSLTEFFGDEYPLKKGHLPSTYTLSPAGKEIMTVHNKYYSRDAGPEGQSSSAESAQEQADENKPAVAEAGDGTQEQEEPQGGAWEEIDMKAYFQGHTAVPEDPEQTGNQVDFPELGYDTHATTPEGKEVISKDNILYFRESESQKEWKATTLGAYFHENTVVNATEGQQEEQLPTVKLNTHAITPKGEEVVTFRDRFWRRQGDTKEWQTGFLKDYFIDQDIERGSLPIEHWNIHMFTPGKKEVIVSGGGVYFRDVDAKTWKREDFENYFKQSVPGANSGEDDIVDEEKYNRIRDTVMAELLKFFRPELVNRFDAAIVFEPLKLKHVMQIARLNLKSLNKLLMEQEMTIQFTESAIREIAIEGYDPMFGARPLRRSIQRLVENPLSELIIAGEAKAGDMVTVDFDGQEMTFHAENAILLEEAGGSTDKPINFTPLVVDVFVEEHFANDKEAVMKEVAEIEKKFPKQTNGEAKEKKVEDVGLPEESSQSKANGISKASYQGNASAGIGAAA